MPFDPASHRHQSRRRWGSRAAAWGRHADWWRHATMPVTAWMVEALAPQSGQTLLELGAGSGDTGFFAAELIRPGGTLICSDLAPEMLTLAQQRAQELGIDGARFLQVDAEAIDLPAASVDGVLCRWGYMLVPDPEVALRETRRVLRPGGRVVLAAWTTPEENVWLSAPPRVLLERGFAEPPAPGEPGAFAWSREEVIADALGAAGFLEPGIDTVELALPYPGGLEDWWQNTYDLSTRFQEHVDPLDDAQRAGVRDALAEHAARHRGPDGALTFPARTWVAVAAA